MDLMTGYMLAFSAGLALSLSGIAYRYAMEGKVEPIELSAMMAVCGAFFYTVRGGAEWSSFCWTAAGIGAISGITQYLPVRLLRMALNIGPLSPAWCMISLGGFVPVIVFSAIFLGEKPTLCQYFSLAATCGAIVFASMGCEGEKGRRITARGKIVFYVLLLLIFLSMGLLNLFLKWCTVLPGPDGVGTMSERQGNVIMVWMYAWLGICAAVDLSITKKWKFNRNAWIGGAILTLGAGGGYLLLLYAMRYSATLVFALPSATSLLTVAVVSTCFFHERRTRAWYAMLGCSILAILLNR